MSLFSCCSSGAENVAHSWGSARCTGIWETWTLRHGLYSCDTGLKRMSRWWMSASILQWNHSAAHRSDELDPILSSKRSNTRRTDEFIAQLRKLEHKPWSGKCNLILWLQVISQAAMLKLWLDVVTIRIWHEPHCWDPARILSSRYTNVHRGVAIPTQSIITIIWYEPQCWKYEWLLNQQDSCEPQWWSSGVISNPQSSKVRCRAEILTQ